MCKEERVKKSRKVVRVVMCDCIKKLNERMDSKHYAVGSTVGSSNSQSSEIRFHPITNSGEPHKHTRGDSVKWEYCPFCGEKIWRIP